MLLSWGGERSFTSKELHTKKMQNICLLYLFIYPHPGIFFQVRINKFLERVDRTGRDTERKTLL